MKDEQRLNRRHFLQSSGLATSMLALGSAQALSSPPATGEASANGTHPAFSPYSFHDVGQRFTFAAIGDPHIIPRDGRGPQWYDDFYRTALDEIAAINPTPAFVIVVGDVVHKPDDEHFAVLLDLSKQSKVPVLWVHGNHDGTAKMPPIFAKYQKAFNGYERYYGSFNAGKWHFLWIPDDDQLANPRLAEEVFAWMDKDLAENRDRPSMLFLHRHLLPVGLSQLEYYACTMERRDQILERVFRYGNVKQVFSGHVHNSIKSSIDSAWSYRGVNFILSPTVHRPRDMGKFEAFPEYMSRYMSVHQPAGGFYMLVDVDGSRVAGMRGRCAGIAGERLYPQQFRTFDPAIDPRWAKPVGQLTPHQELVNGDFEDGLTGWSMPYRFQAEREPLCEWKATDEMAASGKKSAYLLCRAPRNMAGNDDALVELYQTVALPTDARPVLKAHYRPEQKSPLGGGYIRLTGYKQAQPKLWLVFHWGQREDCTTMLVLTSGFADEGCPVSGNSYGKYYEKKQALFWKLDDSLDKWHALEVDIAGLYERVLGGDRRFGDLALDRILLACGVWAGAMGQSEVEVDDHFVWRAKGTAFDQGAFFDGFSLALDRSASAGIHSTNDGRPLETAIEQLKPTFGEALEGEHRHKRPKENRRRTA